MRKVYHRPVLRSRRFELGVFGDYGQRWTTIGDQSTSDLNNSSRAGILAGRCPKGHFFCLRRLT